MSECFCRFRVEEVLEERLHQAEAVASVYMTAAETLRIHNDDHAFQVSSSGKQTLYNFWFTVSVCSCKTYWWVSARKM